jgi:hypothetical protein
MTHDAGVTDSLVGIFGLEISVVLILVLRKLAKILKAIRENKTP